MRLSFSQKVTVYCQSFDDKIPIEESTYTAPPSCNHVLQIIGFSRGSAVCWWFNSTYELNLLQRSTYKSNLVLPQLSGELGAKQQRGLDVS